VERLDCPDEHFGLTNVDVGEVHLQVACQGHGRTAVLLHGYPELYFTWTRIAALLTAEGFRVVAPNLRGYAGSDRPEDVDAYHIDHLVADVAGLLGAVGRERVLLVGHDWGGVIAWVLAHRHPELLSGLVVMNGPHPDVWAHPGVDPVQAEASATYVPLIANGVIGPEVVESRIGPFLAPGEIDQYRAAWAEPMAAVSMGNWFKANIYPTNRIPTGNSTTVATLVLWGMQDVLVTPSQLDHLGPFVSNLKVVRLPDVGHWVPLEAPETVATNIVEFAGPLR
jgi:pimeloyl-ACP methyl ester carboxylesterase